MNTVVNPLVVLQERIGKCRNCTRLVDYREQVGRTKRKSFQSWNYWSKPVPSFGDQRAKVVFIGLAPAAHGGNRTGRMFTGDASAKFLMSTLHEVGFASQPTSDYREDGLTLHGIYITAAVRCVPPQDKPTATEISACAPYLSQELDLLKKLQAVVVLGKVAFDAYLRFLSQKMKQRVKLTFRHGARYEVGNNYPVLFVSYHPSPRNYNTGRLTRESFIGLLNAVKDEVM